MTIHDRTNEQILINYAPKWWKDWRRLDYLLGLEKEIEIGIRETYEEYEQMSKSNTPYWFREYHLNCIKEYNAMYSKIQWEIRKIVWGDEIEKGKLTYEQIGKAKSRDISEFTGIGKGVVYCMFHEDRKTPNMHIYGNKFHCYACGKHGDTIDYIRQARGLSFVEAVKYLQGG
jgi:hypothetical protein